MKPIYKTESYYEIKFTTHDKSMDIYHVSDAIKADSLANAQVIIDDKINTIKTGLDDGGSIGLVNIEINPKEEVLDKSIILGWEDARPGDYAVHIHSKNNVNDTIEVGFDFYVAKLNRDGNTIVDRYYLCWHSYQGCFLITRYIEDSDDKNNNILILTIYDTRLFPSIDELDGNVFKQWAYSKVAKYASIYSLEEPNREQNKDVEV